MLPFKKEIYTILYDSKNYKTKQSKRSKLNHLYGKKLSIYQIKLEQDIGPNSLIKVWRNNNDWCRKSIDNEAKL